MAIPRVGKLPPRSPISNRFATPSKGNSLDYQDTCSTTDDIAPTVLQGGHAACVFIRRVEQPTDN
jgi:hypothetical protein